MTTETVGRVESSAGLVREPVKGRPRKKHLVLLSTVKAAQSMGAAEVKVLCGRWELTCKFDAVPRAEQSTGVVENRLSECRACSQAYRRLLRRVGR